jgi:hypothetical protein
MRTNICIVFATVMLLTSCKKTTPENLQVTNLTFTTDTVFNASFFPKGDAFTGGDGTYSIPLPDGRSLWIFGDSFIGGVTTDLKRLKTEPAYIRNCFTLLAKDSLVTLQQGAPHEFKSMMIPPEVTSGKYSEHDYWYWPGDAFIENGNLNVFASKFFQEKGTDMWAFQFQGTELIEFSLPDFKVLRIDRFPEVDSVHYGHAVLETDDFTYIYGLKKQFPYAARAKKGNVRDTWQFYTGKEWVDQAAQAEPMIQFSGSEQFSVFKWEGTYIMIMQGGDLSRKIYSFTSTQPYGPWENQQLLYETPLPQGCDACWTYNALAHPEFMTEEAMLLISYNTNSMEMNDHYENATIYRPRFIRVPMAKILPK